MGNRFSLLTNARHVNTDYLVYSMMSLVSSAAAETQLQCRGAADQKMSKRLERTLRGRACFPGFFGNRNDGRCCHQQWQHCEEKNGSHGQEKSAKRARKTIFPAKSRDFF